LFIPDQDLLNPGECETTTLARQENTMASVWPKGMTGFDRFNEEQAMHKVIGINAYETLTLMNWLYGQGEIASLSFDTETQRGVVTLYVLHGQKTAKFRIIDGVVHYRGHHRKIGT
jgi:hypothetical protein